jgi:hypothetical protein
MLTDEEIEEMIPKQMLDHTDYPCRSTIVEFARAIEKSIEEKHLAHAREQWASVWAKFVLKEEQNE